MFTKFFRKKENGSKTGIFKIENNSLIELNETPGNGSINSVIEHFDYPNNLVHTILTFNSKKIECLGFKVLSKELIFVIAKSENKNISYSDIVKEVNSIDWNFEYSSLNIEEILNDAVEFENLSLDFLKSVINDLNLINDKTYKSERLGLYFHFENNILKSFSSTSFENSATKWLKSLNPYMFQQMLKEASMYQDSEEDAMKEVNLHCDAILNIPQAVKNEYVDLHKTKYNNVNFYNILNTHYRQDCFLEEFLFANKGRVRKVDSKTFEVGNFIYEFGENNQLIKVQNK